MTKLHEIENRAPCKLCLSALNNYIQENGENGIWNSSIYLEMLGFIQGLYN